MCFYRTQALGFLLSLLLSSSPFTQAIDLDHEQSPLSQADDSLFTQDQISDVISSSPLLSFHRSLCEIESISNNEHAVGNFLVSYLKKHDFNVLRQEVPLPSDSKDKRHRFNVFAWPKDPASTFTSDGGPEDQDDELGDFAPKVILTSHIDTVPPFIPYSLSYPSVSPPTISADGFNRSEILISGRGTVDAKACVAAQTHAVLSLLQSHHHNHEHNHNQQPSNTTLPSLPPPPIALLFVTSEETTGSGMKTFSHSALHTHLSRHYRSLIFGEPTESLLASGHKGLLLFRLRARGIAAHSGYPWLGRSAVGMLLPVLAVVDRLGEVAEGEGGLARSAKYGKSTVNIGVLRGGVAVNVVPERAEAEVAVRLAGGTTEGAKRVIERAVKGVGGGVEVEFTKGVGYSPVDLNVDVEGFGSVAVNYGTDVPNWVVGREGVKRYLYGPGSILVAHGDREGLKVGELEASVEGYRRLIEAGLGGGVS